MDKGTIAFWMNHDHPDWATNNNAYKFGPFNQGAIGVSAFKNADRTLEIRFAAEHFGHTFRGPMPTPSDKGVHVRITWENEITLYVNGEKVQSAPFKPVSH